MVNFESGRFTISGADNILDKYGVQIITRPVGNLSRVSAIG
jgi:hypothetical protein